ncbi:hypothetical protein DYU11_17235 [Fibrisoma montanum]|uniref:Outer membrane protein beta-barrel domain-containing protein n=1 Tax=Fibrisoma montanum TaxID=2305895 RepID=A0A418M5Q4_9BACT|nr:hypothetical protein [Fibrisoma montanum]RIV21171.1 hypothetical protein DYU11_17235 [Fibrisoma montanum]
MKTNLFATALTLALLMGWAWAHAQVRLDLESGLVLGTNYNKVRIPNQGGTTFNLAEDLSVKPKVFYRIRLGYTIADRHTISALYAPLTVRYEGAFPQPVNYNNVVFPADRATTAYYTFNSYRLTYRYDFVRRERWRVGAGLTAKIRDANVRLVSENRDTGYDNVGFVPLLNVYAAYRPTEQWTILVEGDALGSRFGRAEDIFAGLAYQLSPAVGLKAGYRVVEGGADVDDVYNFTWINYASVGLLVNF